MVAPTGEEIALGPAPGLIVFGVVLAAVSRKAVAKLSPDAHAATILTATTLALAT